MQGTGVPSQKARGFPVLEWLHLPSVTPVESTGRLRGFFHMPLGAVVQGHWFSGAWLAKQVSQFIEYKHLFPIVVAAYIRGPPMGLQTGQRPNCSVAEILRSGTSKAPCHHVLGSLSVLIDSLTFLLFH